MTASPYVIGVGDLSPGVRRPVVVEDTPDWGVDKTAVAGLLHAELVVEGHAGGVMVTGTARAHYSSTCDRCLNPFDSSVAIRIGQDFVADEDGEYVVSGEQIDTEPMLRDEVLLAIPLVPLCRSDCRGLCPECGTDLNTGACSGHETSKDSPFAELRSLFDQE